MSLLTSRRLETDLDVVAFSQLALREGWSDGLPVVPPTPELVERYIRASGRSAASIVAQLPSHGVDFSVEKVAINAVMAGAPAESMPLLLAALEAMSAPDFDLAGLNATTASVNPAVLVNGPIRDRLAIPYGSACFGGVAGPAPAMGRALQLVMRNIAGQRAGDTSESVFGQPARIAGIVVGEWEERSPWEPLAQRRGVAGDALTTYGAMGTTAVVDIVAQRGRSILEVIGKSAAYLGANNFLAQAVVSEILVAINPVWADGPLRRDVPDIDEVQGLLWQYSSLPIDRFPAGHQDALEVAGRVRAGGLVHLVPDPSDVLVLVCGGLGGLHATMLHCFSGTRAVTKAIPSP